MLTDQLYFYFRKLGSPSGDILSLIIIDLSDRPALNSGRKIALRNRGRVVAHSIPIENAKYPEIIASMPVRPSAYIEYPIDYSYIKDGVSVFDCVDSEGRRLSEAAVFGLPVNVPYPVPEEFNTRRVAARTGPAGFLVGGASWYAALRALAEREIGGLNPSTRILDWGAGCGRVARFFIYDGFQNVHGVDIDAINVEWSQNNLPGGQFSRCDFDPPTQYEDSSFDVIYGHSVFTHLDQASEISWLKELNRILRPDGFACCTISSEYTARLAFAHLLTSNPDTLSALIGSGRLDYGADRVGVDMGREGYYRTVSHTRDYIHRVWSEYVEVCRIIPGFADNQDAVVFRKRTSPKTP